LGEGNQGVAKLFDCPPEEVALSNTVSMYIDRLKTGILPNFNTFLSDLPEF
jgi:hypothetical protein